MKNLPTCNISEVKGNTNIFLVFFNIEESHFMMTKDNLTSIFSDIKCLERIDEDSEYF